MCDFDFDLKSIRPTDWSFPSLPETELITGSIRIFLNRFRSILYRGLNYYFGCYYLLMWPLIRQCFFYSWPSARHKLFYSLMWPLIRQCFYYRLLTIVRVINCFIVLLYCTVTACILYRPTIYVTPAKTCASINSWVSVIKWQLRKLEVCCLCDNCTLTLSFQSFFVLWNK